MKYKIKDLWKWIKKNKFNLWIISVAIILGILASLNHCGALVYEYFKIIDPLRIPSCCWDQLDHFSGSLAFMIASSICGFLILNFISKKRKLNWNKKNLLIGSFIVFTMIWIKLLHFYERGKHFLDFKIFVFDIIAIFISGLLIYLMRNKITS